jgi:hypothetical protein
LGAFIPVAARHVKQHAFAAPFEQLLTALLKQRGGLRDQATGAALLVREGPHLPNNFAAAGFFHEGVLSPQRRDDGFFGTGINEGSSGSDFPTRGLAPLPYRR